MSLNYMKDDMKKKIGILIRIHAVWQKKLEFKLNSNQEK